MLISYPILPAGLENQTDAARLNAMMAMVQTDRGLYPVTSGDRWHGGIHLNSGNEPICAIADGEIVAYRMATTTSDYASQGAYDTSFVLLKHDTETGEHTRAVFYSLYMHLRPKGLLTATQRNQLAPFLRDAVPGDAAQRPQNQARIWRKEVLGYGGQLYGNPTVHFEIFATQADFQRFWRDCRAIPEGGHGSADAFGDTHFIIPQGRRFAATHARANTQHHIDFPGDATFPLDRGQQGQNTERLHVVVSLMQGRRVAATYRLDANGRIAGPVGTPIIQENYEYELFRLAKALYPDCPSAGFEYLRFGRILGPDRTARAENWQLIRYADNSIGYIDLAATENLVTVLSDADFPLLWQRLDESETASPEDGIANIQQLDQLLQLPTPPSNASLFAPPDFVARTRNSDTALALRHFICKHPTEWDASDLEARYAKLREPGGQLHAAKDWEDFSGHVKAMAFWSHTGLERSVWHFHPLQFIAHYRGCIWLSHQEFARCIPRSSRSGRVEWTTAIARAQIHATPYNKYIRKYCGSSRKRLAHNLAQSYIESGLLRTVEEDGRGNGHAYGPHYGRGYHQLTWAGNYRDYGTYKAIPNVPPGTVYSDNRITATSTHPVDGGGTQIRWHPRYDPRIITTDLDHAAESSGYFWVSKGFRGRKNMNRVCDLDFDTSSVGFNCWLINGGGNGYAHRQQFAKFLANVLLDAPLLSGSVRFQYPPLSPPGNPTLCRTFPPSPVAATLNETAHYESQTP